MLKGYYLSLSLLSAAAYAAAVFLVRSDYSRADFATFLAIFLGLSGLWGAALLVARRAPPPRSWIVGAAVAFRLLLLPAGYDFEAGEYRRLILYDDDLWRYLWEGHAASAGINPFETPPNDLEEFNLELEDPPLYQRIYDKPLWGEVFDNVGYRQYPSPYHVTAHAVFGLAHALSPGSVLALRLVIIGFDLGIVWLLAKLCTRLGAGDFPLLAYAWNPLVIKEFAGSAHIDAVLLCFLLAAVLSAKPVGTAWLAVSALVKPTPLFLAPAFWKRFGWKALIAPAVAVAAWALATPKGALAYTRFWVFNQALSRLLPEDRLLELAFPAITVAAVAAYWFFRRDDGSLEGLVSQAVWILGAFLLTTPMFAPWYLTWLLPFAAIRRNVFWLTLSGTIFLSYHAYLRFEETPWVVALQYGVPLAAWLAARASRKTIGEHNTAKVSGTSAD